MSIAVIGGGWAGLSAAARLARAGRQVTLYEAGRGLGGRARRVHAPPLDGAPMDNGQHILLGAYTGTLSLMRALGADPDAAFWRLPLSLASADGRYALRAPAWPAPWHLIGAILGASGSSLGDRLRLAWLVAALRRKGWRTPAGATVQQWLDEGGQPASLQADFWRPLCLAAMNTPPALACAQLFAHVLRDSLGGPAGHTDLLLPRQDLSALWPDRLRNWTGPGPAPELRLGHAVRGLALAPGGVEVDGRPHDAALVATSPPVARRLLEALPGSPAGAGLLAALDAFEFLPIATLTLELAGPWPLPSPMLMLAERPERGWHGQWLFEHSRLAHGPGARRPAGQATRLTVVISDARALLELPAAEVARTIAGQVAEQTAASGRTAPMPAVARHALIVEKRATFAAVPGLRRPGHATPWRGVWLAGDWTDTGYPGVLEGAVRSGEQAARALLAP